MPLKMRGFAVTFMLTVMRRRATPLKMKDFALSFTLSEVYLFTVDLHQALSGGDEGF